MTKDQRQMLNDLLDVEDGLTAWEVNFVDDIDTRDREADGSYRLTQRQERTLTRLWETKA